jgi:hypothetical protein
MADSADKGDCDFPEAEAVCFSDPCWEGLRKDRLDPPPRSEFDFTPGAARCGRSRAVCSLRKRTEYLRFTCPTGSSSLGAFTDHSVRTRMRPQCSTADPAKAGDRLLGRGVSTKSIVGKRRPYIRKSVCSGTFGPRFDRVDETSSFYHCKGMTEREFCCIPNSRVSTSLHFSARPVNVRSQFFWSDSRKRLRVGPFGIPAWPANCATKQATFPLIDWK